MKPLPALLVAAALAASAAAQPANDDCLAAQPIAEGLTPGDTLGATEGPFAGDCAAFGAPFGADVWFTWVAPADGVARASLVDGGGFADFDTVLAAFAGGCLAPVQLACNDDAATAGGFSFQSRIEFEVQAGQSILIELGGWDGASGSFVLALSFQPATPPGNDECVAASTILEGVTEADSFFATQSPVSPPCGFGGLPAGADVWFRHVATATGLFTASLVDGGGYTTFDTVLAVWSGSCGALDPLGCNDDAGFSLGSKVQAFVEEGQELFLAVGGFAGASGSFGLAVSTLAGGPPDNDECATALPVTAGPLAGTTVFASDSPVTGSCASFGATLGRDVWFAFTAPGDGLLTASTAPSGGGSADFDTVLALFAGDCDGLVELGCNDDFEGLLSLVAAPVEQGQTILVELGGWSGDSGSFVLSLSFLAEEPGPAVVLGQAKISDTQGGFEGDLSGGTASFGIAVAPLGDLDGDGTPDVAVGSPFEGLDQPDAGAVWILFLEPDGSVKSHARIAAGAGGFGGATGHSEWGVALAALGDLGGDGTLELAVGAPGDDDGGADRGAVWLLSLAPDGSVAGQLKISDTQGGFGGAVANGDALGSSLCVIGDLDGDGLPELGVGAPGRDDSDPNAGAAWVWFLTPAGTVHDWQRISDTNGLFQGVLDEDDAFGGALAGPGDLDGDGLPELVVGAAGDDDGGPQRGALWVLSLLPDGKVKDERKVSATQGGFGGLLLDGALFGKGLAAAGDLDGDGVGDLFAGAIGDGDGGPFVGAVWILFLRADGSVEGHAKISAEQGGFAGPLPAAGFFGEAPAAPGDLDGDGRADLLVGQRFDDDGAPDRGAVWVVFLDAANPWITLGGALAGSAGLPRLEGQGPLVGDTKATLRLSSAAPAAPAIVVQGAQEAGAPLFGGTLVPAPDVVLTGLFTRANGTLQLSGRWPVGVPPGFELWFQAWVVDAAAAEGWSASNGLKAVTH